MPHGGLSIRADDRDAKESLGQREQPFEYLRQREIRAQSLLRVIEARFSEPLRKEGHIPELDCLYGAGPARLRSFRRFLCCSLCRVVTKRIEVRTGRLDRRRSQLFEKSLDRRDIRRHLRIDRQFCKTREAQNLGHLMSQHENSLDDLGVVELTAARACDVRSIELFSAFATLTVFEKWDQHRGVQTDSPWALLRCRSLDSVFPRVLCGQLLQAIGHARHLDGIRDQHRECLGGVEDVIAEVCSQLREFGLNLVEPRARRLVEADPSMLRFSQQGLYDASL